MIVISPELVIFILVEYTNTLQQFIQLRLDLKGKLF
jgi:hypothetical protein